MILDFTAIDFETAYYRKESACSIGLVRFRDGEEVDSFYSLIRPPSLYVRPDFTAMLPIWSTRRLSTASGRRCGILSAICR